MRKKKVDLSTFGKINEYGIRVFTKEEQVQLAQLKDEGNMDARNLLVEAYQGLLKKLVNDKANQLCRSNDEQFKNDLMSHAWIGLIDGIDRYDWRVGTAISTYITPCIKNEINRGFQNEGRTIRLPVHIQEAQVKIRKAVNEIEMRGEEVTESEILQITGLEPKKLHDAIQYNSPVESLDEPIENSSEGDEVSRGDKIRAENTDIDEKMEKKTRDEILNDAIGTLNEREALIIWKRRGLCGYEKNSLEKIGKEFNLSRERVRQIESESIEKIKNYCIAHGILELLVS